MSARRCASECAHASSSQAWRRGLLASPRTAAWGLLVLMIAGCATPQRAPAPPPAAAPTSVEGLVAAIQANSRRSDRGTDGNVRAQLADEANGYADLCIAQAPRAAACLYGRAVALGLEARAHPTRANELLKSMLDSLNAAESADPDYDQAGPSRVRALVLIRAPGWPLGPGDADAGLESAQRAVRQRPQYPPNLLALAEARAKTGDAAGAKEAYGRAREAAQAWPAGEDRDGWLREADQGPQRK
jgi:hypothetical protein